jgi:methyl-accepting chemotaxis protein
MVMFLARMRVQARLGLLVSLALGLGIATGWMSHGSENPWVRAILLGSGLLVAAGLLLVVTVSIVRPLAAFREAVARGDLSLRLPDEGRNELAELGRALNGFLERTAGSVRLIRKESAHVASLAGILGAGSSEMQQATHLVARGTETQRHAAEQVSAAIHQLSASVEQVARSVETALGRARSSRELAQEGATYGETTAQAMEGIRSATARIVKAVGVIQEIARQTNLLSLNAAIEAAKAGSMGKGFSVVAEEVRKLAERSSSSAKEIGALIEETNASVSEGGAKAAGTASALSRIQQEISALLQQLEEIGIAAREQAVTSQEINKQTETSRVTSEQNAAGSAQMSASVQQTVQVIEDLAKASEVMAAQMATFRLEDETGNLDRSAAIAAHQAWSARLKAVLDGTNTETLDPATVCQDNRCTLGIWLHGPGQKACGHLGSFPTLVERHAGFHRLAGQILTDAGAGRRQQAAELLAGDFSLVSREVIGLLSQLAIPGA